MQFKSSVLSLALIALLASTSPAQDHIFFDGGPFYDEVLFEESFNKGQGPLAETRTITVGPDLQSPVRIFLRNGDPVSGASVSNGAITLNGQLVFGANDFRVEQVGLWAVVTKQVDLLLGDNTLDVSLKGGGSATVSVLILRPTAVPSDAICVAPPAAGGADHSQCGPPSSPCETITYGISQAGTSGHTSVLVANGVYVENVTLADGIDVLGGFSASFSTRNVLSTGTVVHGAESAVATIVASNITSPTLFEGFIVQGPFVAAAGAHSIAVLSEESTDGLVIRNNLILAGVAGHGVEGGSGPDGPDGPVGSPGLAAVAGESTLPGGAGGARTDDGTNISGGHGGLSSPPIYGVQNGHGVDGRGPTPGPGGAGGISGRLALAPGFLCVFDIGAGPEAGSNGQNGSTGPNGSGGPGGAASDSGSNGFGNWVTAGGENGTDGTPGSGGGGGGAGGGAAVDWSSPCAPDPHPITGPSGGGGGAGGASGKRGYGGSGGGATFGIFVSAAAASPPLIEHNRIFLGRAGDGGDGGRGGMGGLGGHGGLGGQCQPLFGCGNAGDGGKGGDGGHAGGGGGGAGGDSIGIFSNFAGGYSSVNTIDISTGMAGAGGRGGSSAGGDGLDGGPGAVFDVRESM